MTITLKSKYGLYDYSELEGNGIKPDEGVCMKSNTMEGEKYYAN